jgi:hypothetical protein
VRESKSGRSHGADGDDLRLPKQVTGKELSSVEELSARLTALVEMLDEKGVISAREYSRVAAMRLHEISKAAAFEELEDEL